MDKYTEALIRDLKNRARWRCSGNDVYFTSDDNVYFLRVFYSCVLKNIYINNLIVPDLEDREIDLIIKNFDEIVEGGRRQRLERETAEARKRLDLILKIQ